MKIYSLAAKNTAYLEGVCEAFTGALVASSRGELISVFHAGINQYELKDVPYTNIQDQNGNVFNSAQETVNYLNSVFVVQQNASLTFTFQSPITPWVINHNLGYYPSVKLYSMGNAEIDADVQNITINQVQVNFAQPTAGFARLF